MKTLEQAAEAYDRMTGHSGDKETFIHGAEWLMDHPQWIDATKYNPTNDKPHACTNGTIIFTGSFDGAVWRSGQKVLIVTHFMPLPKMP